MLTPSHELTRSRVNDRSDAGRVQAEQDRSRRGRIPSHQPSRTLRRTCFRCTRTFPDSGTPSGFLRALGCGCGRALHRRAHNMPMVPNVYSCHQLGLHGRHRKRRAQISPLKPPSSSATRETPTPQNWCAKHCLHHQRHRELLCGQEGKNYSDVTLGLYVRRRRVPMISEKAKMQLPSIKGVGQQQQTDCAQVLTSCHETSTMGRALTTATGSQESDRFGVDFTKSLCCLAESHLPLHCALCEVGDFGFRARKDNGCSTRLAAIGKSLP